MESKRNVDVLIEHEYYTDPKTGVEILSTTCFTVWADAETKEAIEKVEGVSWVFSDQFTPTKFTVYFDKRYDVESIKREVEAAVKCF